MIANAVKSWIEGELGSIRAAGMYKEEKLITSPQGSRINTQEGSAINFCANNYLGLADAPEIIKAVEQGMKTHGFGMASVRFICGTQDIHKELERKITEFMGAEDTILYTSCFDANTGLFETLLSPEDALISDELNHASIIDGVRLCRAERKRFKHSDMESLEKALKETQDARFRLIVTDGVFSMQGDLARLPDICDLAQQYDALVMVDDSHATGFVGPNGRGTAEALGVADRIDITTSTLGKALGGASGGFTTGPKEIVELLRQRSRTYLFSNTLAPPIVAGALKALELVQSDTSLRKTLHENAAYFRSGMERLGFEILPGNHPIVPIMLRDELKTVELAQAVNRQGIFVVGFSFPVVPKGEARIRVQLSAAHTREQLDRALEVFKNAGDAVGAI
ncbi:MAG: glycine C-acetyltransferase [SAR202 cluster bacterium]|jgi:glycine C-acetyltransferase|nr:glycine C-acetyltransferase [SAR202 cluster bacterium]